MSGDDGLREAIARAMADATAARRGMPPFSDISWACVRQAWMGDADALLPVVTAYAEQRARERAAEELRDYANEIDDPYEEYSAQWLARDLRDHAAALAADDRTGQR